MDPVEQTLLRWKQSLPSSIEAAALFARNQTAHKWMAPYRSLTLREVVFWRLQDLLAQSYVLHQQSHTLGARILLRSGYETLALLIYLNQLTANVLDGSLNFHVFSNKTAVLLLGSRNESTNHKAINIVTVLERADKRYSGLMKFYGNLSESAHPNYEGTCVGYSTIDHENYVTAFANRWTELYAERHLRAMQVCMEIFESEYNVVWVSLNDKLEAWIEANDDELEATKEDTGLR